MKEKNVDEMSESELKKELKNLYQKLNELDDAEIEELNFKARMKLRKKNAEGEVVETRETSI